MSRKGRPDNVRHKNYSAFFLPNIGPQIHETTIKKGRRSYTGVGWDRKQSKRKAAENYRRGRQD